MKRRIRARSSAALVLVGAALAGSGCTAFLPRSTPAQFYVLDFEPGGAAEAALPIALGVGPIQLPGYVDRPQMVTRSMPNQVAYSETHRWATALQQNVTTVLMADLGNRLGTDRLSSFPFALGLPRDSDVSVDFLHFEPAASGEVLIEAIWRIQDPRTGAELFVKRSTLSRSAPAGDYSAMAAALSDGLGELADQIARALREVRARG